MFLLKKLFSSLLLPPVGPLLLVAGGLLVLRRRRFGLSLAWGGLALLFALSTPSVAELLLHTLRAYPPLTAQAARGAQAIVVLGGGVQHHAEEYAEADVPGPNSLLRLRYGVRLQRQSQLPLLLSGGAPEGGSAEAEVMARTLRDDYGISARWLESASLDTHENAQRSAALLRADGVHTVLLVTEGFHMRRAVLEFEAAGLRVIAAPTVIRPLAEGGTMALLPGATALKWSAQAIKEWLGIAVAMATRKSRAN